MSCMYASDFLHIGGYENAHVFRGWGKEDVDLYARLLDSKCVLRAYMLHVIRLCL